LNDKKKERILSFKSNVKKGNNIPFYISSFFDQNIEKIKEGKDIKFEHWKKFVKVFPNAKETVGKPNKRTFKHYRNLWFLSNFNKTYRKFYDKDLFEGKSPYIKVNLDENIVESFPQVPRTFICSYIYSLLLENELSIQEIIQKVNNFILNDEYEKVEDFQSFLENYHSERSSRNKNKINEKDFIELKEVLRDPKYGEAFKNYFSTLIKLTINIKKLSETKEEKKRGISPSKLVNNFNLSFSKTELSEIIKYLKNRYDLSFFYSERELDWLKENGINLRKVKNTRTRWYWIKEKKYFKNSISKEVRSGLELAFEFFEIFVASKFRKKNIRPTAKNFRSTKYRYLYEKLKDIKKHNELLQMVGLSPVHE